MNAIRSRESRSMNRSPNRSQGNKSQSPDGFRHQHSPSWNLQGNQFEQKFLSSNNAADFRQTSSDHSAYQPIESRYQNQQQSLTCSSPAANFPQARSNSVQLQRLSGGDRMQYGTNNEFPSARHFSPHRFATNNNQNWSNNSGQSKQIDIRPYYESHLYYQQYGYPRTPCKCGILHFYRHCKLNLKD